MDIDTMPVDLIDVFPLPAEKKPEINSGFGGMRVIKGDKFVRVARDYIDSFRQPNIPRALAEVETAQDELLSLFKKGGLTLPQLREELKWEKNYRNEILGSLYLSIRYQAQLPSGKMIEWKSIPLCGDYL